MSANKQTDLSKRLRAIAPEYNDGEYVKMLLLQSAEEIERYYTGMLNWKATAEAKDAAAAQPVGAVVADERAAFEAKFPIPRDCYRGREHTDTEDRYDSRFNSWDCDNYNRIWEGFQAGFALATQPAEPACKKCGNGIGHDLDCVNHPGDAPAKPADVGGVGEKLPELPGCLADRLYEAINIAIDRALKDNSTARIRKWKDTAADLRTALAAQTAAPQLSADPIGEFQADARQAKLDEFVAQTAAPGVKDDRATFYLSPSGEYCTHQVGDCKLPIWLKDHSTAETFMLIMDSLLPRAAPAPAAPVDLSKLARYEPVAVQNNGYEWNAEMTSGPGNDGRFVEFDDVRALLAAGGNGGAA